LDWSDPELVERARRGDGAAFHGLVDRHAAALYALAVNLVGRDDAEDVVQETLAGAFAGLSGFRSASSVKTWMTRILVRQAAGHWRKRKLWDRSTAARPSVAGAGVPTPSQAADARMDVADALKDLSPEHREVVVLREMQGLSYEEMAEVLGVPRGTVESRLFRARRELQKLLTGYSDA